MRVKAIVMMFLFVFCTVDAGAAQTFTEPVSCWKLDEESGVRGDSIGTNHLTDNNTVGYAAGHLDNAAVFVDTNSEYLSSSSTELKTPTAFSLTGWFNADNPSTSTDQVMFANSSDLSYVYWRYGIRIKSNKAYGIIGHGASGYTEVTATPTITASTWIFFSLVFDNDNDLLNIWINGTEDSTAQTSETLTAGNLFALGRPGQYGLRYYDGQLDNVSFYDVVLDDTEIANLYNEGNGVTCTDLLTTSPATGTAASHGITLPSGDTGVFTMSMTAGEAALAAGLGLLVLLATYEQLSRWGKAGKVR